MTSDSENNLFEEIYNSELVNMVNIATFFLGSHAAGEEAAQDAFIKLHTNWDDVQNPVAFVKRSLVNRCKDLLKMRDRRVNRHKLVSNSELHDDEHHYLIDLLQELEPKRRIIVVLRFYGNYKLAEIAEYLDVPEGTVRSNLYRGLDQLRGLLPSESKV